MSPQGWEIVIAAAALGLMQLLNLVLNYLREQRRLDREERLATALREVKVATNSLVHDLVAVTAAKSHAEGVKEEHERGV